MSMQDRTIVRGTTVNWSASIVDENGDAVDMTVGTRKLVLRIKTASGTTTKDTDTSADWTWVSQSGGTGYWTFTITETLALARGKFLMDVIFVDEATTPYTKRLVGDEATLTVKNPIVGAVP
jgi:hypothetical protein